MELLSFQKESVNRMCEFLRERHCVYNACEMGLGKTAQAISACNSMQFNTVLVVCPAIMVRVWEKEILKWRNGPICKLECGGTAKLYPYYHVVSYNKASQQRTLTELRSISFDCLILDEAHYIKTKSAKRTKIILNELWPIIPFRICLSGTPFTQSVMDCWTLFSRMAPEDFGDYWKFAHTYTKVKQTPWGPKFEGIKNADKLKAITRSKFFIRYTKAEVLTELPPKVWQKITLGSEYAVKLNAEDQKRQEEYLKFLQESYIRKTHVNAVPPKAVATFRREQGMRKVKPAAEFCKELLEQQIPIIVFAYHLNVIEALQTALSKYAPAVITGRTSAADRNIAVDRFQNGDGTCFIGQIAAAGVGLTLTKASTVIFVEESFSPADMSQAADRAHRIGQKDTVHVYYFVVDSSIDEKLMDIVFQKVTTFNSVLNA